MALMKLWNNNTPSSPIKRMIEFLEAAQRGDFSVTLPVTSPGELGELERCLNQLVLELHENRERWEEQKAIQKELKVSRVIQSTLLPTTTPDIPGLEIQSFYRPAKQIGGDYYDFINVDADHLGIVVADVSGKSVSGAMLMTIVHNTLRAQAMLTLSPSEVLARTQKLLLPNMMSQFFVSVFYAVLDKRYLRLTCANAGHPPLLVYRASSGQCEWIRPEGIAVGLCRDGHKPVAVEEREVDLEKGDLAFFYTDGITDASNAQDDRFGRKRIEQVALRSASKGGLNFLSDLQRELATFSGERPNDDDITAVILYRKKDLG